jgi:hypothetical protein
MNKLIICTTKINAHVDMKGIAWHLASDGHYSKHVGLTKYVYKHEGDYEKFNYKQYTA